MGDPNCPKCSKDFVKRVRREGIGELLTSLFYVYPFKCQLCGQRFRSVQWGVKYIRVEEDRREYNRVAISIPVSIAGEHIDGKGMIIDISMAACTLSSDAQLAEGNIVRLALQISKDALPVRVEAAVVRSLRSRYSGVEFLKFQEGDRDRLQIFIRGLLIDRRK